MVRLPTAANRGGPRDLQVQAGYDSDEQSSVVRPGRERYMILTHVDQMHALDCSWINCSTSTADDAQDHTDQQETVHSDEDHWIAPPAPREPG